MQCKKFRSVGAFIHVRACELHQRRHILKCQTLLQTGDQNQYKLVYTHSAVSRGDGDHSIQNYNILGSILKVIRCSVKGKNGEERRLHCKSYSVNFTRVFLQGMCLTVSPSKYFPTLLFVIVLNMHS